MLDSKLKWISIEIKLLKIELNNWLDEKMKKKRNVWMIGQRSNIFYEIRLVFLDNWNVLYLEGIASIGRLDTFEIADQFLVIKSEFT